MQEHQPDARHDGGPPDTGTTTCVVPEINLGSDAADARDAGDGADAPPACTGPKCPVVLATDTDPGCCIVADGNYVYWVSNAGIRLSDQAGAAAGGTPESFERSDFGVSDMAIKDGVLYWVASDGIYRQDLASARGSATKIASDSPQFSQFGVNSSAVYWADVAGSPIHKTPAAGGTTVDFATTTQAQYVAADETNVYWSDSGSDGRLVRDGAGRRWNADGGRDRSDQSGGHRRRRHERLLREFVDAVRHQVLEDAAEGGARPSWSRCRRTSARTRSPSMRPTSTGPAYNKIGKAPIAGGSVTTFATGQYGAMAIAVDATNVYWLNSDGGALMKLAK